MFRNVYCNWNYTRVSMPSMFTSIYPRISGIVEPKAQEKAKPVAQSYSLNVQYPYLTEILSSEGYQTAMLLQNNWAEKGDAIDKEHLDIWSDLYQNLTPEEMNALFYSLKMVKHPPNHMVYNQGEIRSCLYFIDQGRLKMFYSHGEKASLLKTLGAGDIFGEDTFFYSDSFCSASVITDSPAKIYVLFKDRLDLLHAETPRPEFA